MPLVTRIDWADRKAGDIGVLRGHGVVSDAIMLGERLAGEVTDGQEWSHAFVVATNAIFEAVWPKIGLSPWSIYNGRPTALFRIDTSDAAKHVALVQVIEEYVGKGYDLVGALGMAALEIDEALNLPAYINDLANAHKAWCSELTTRFVAKLLPDNENPATTSPQRFYNYMRGLC